MTGEWLKFPVSSGKLGVDAASLVPIEGPPPFCLEGCPFLAGWLLFWRLCAVFVHLCVMVRML